MKCLVVNGLINNIKKYNNYDERKISEIRYGLEALYLTITKIIVISIISILIGYFKEMIIFVLSYGLLRLTGFGLHAKKSLDCWISSLIIFILIPYLIRNLLIPLNVFYISLPIMLILVMYYAPADSEKRPLINKKKRITYKILTSVITIIYSLLIISSANIYIQNLLFFSILIQTFLILPISYKMFKLPYNNYSNYEVKGGKI